MKKVSRKVLVEETGKGLKLQFLLSIVSTILFTILLVTSLVISSPSFTIFCLVMLAGSFIWFIVIKIMIWWEHK